MEVVAVDADRPAEAILRRAVVALCRGALLIYPTDTLYALGGRALDADACRRVRRAKGRDEGKALPLVAADLDQVRGLCGSWPPVADTLAARFWPGPLTLVFPAGAVVPEEVHAGRGSVAVRVPDRSLTRALCAEAGPLVSTSANRAGVTPPATCEDAARSLAHPEAVELALDAGPAPRGSSTIVDLTGASPRLLRAGPVDWREVEAVLDSRGP